MCMYLCLCVHALLLDPGVFPQGLAYSEHVCICLLWPPVSSKLVCARGCGLYPVCVALCSQRCLILACPKPYAITSSQPVPTSSFS